MQVSHPQQYSQYEQRNAAFVPPSRIVHQAPRDLSPPQTPGMAPPPMGMHQASQSEDLTSPQRPGAQNRQSTGFFSAFSRSKSASSGQILSPPATPGVNQLQHAPNPPEQGQQIHHNESSPPSRMLAASPTATHSTGATPNPDASVGGHPAQAPPPPTSQQPLPKPEEPFALGPTGIPLHPELRSVLRLNSIHQQKIYYSGRLSKRVERGTDGTRPAKDEGWIDIWCQLGGVTLSIWNMQAIEEANARGEQVPPQYVNVTDAFVQVLGSVTFPATPTTPAKRYTNVLTLNTAGSNLLLFVCESPAALVSWAAALRLAAWEKSRLEEIYTAHLLRITLTESRVWKEPRTTLVKGQLEGWVRVRVAGQTDWKRFWVVISAGSSLQTPITPGAQSTLSLTRTNSQDSPTKPKKGRLSGLFSRNSHQHTSSTGSAGGNNVLTRTTTHTDAPNMQFFSSSKPKEKKNPILSVWSVTQAFAVYPERPDLITRSTLVKVEGRLGREEGAGAIKGTEAWVLIMPEVENGQPAGPRKMLEWLVALHDAFKLYGRPQQYSFNPHNVASLMFAYPIEPNLEQLFLERELAESLDPRDDSTSTVRSRLTAILQERMRNPVSRTLGPGPSPSPPSNQQQQPLDLPLPNQPVSGAGRQPATGGRGPALTPITERSTTGETRTYTAGDSVSPPNWSAHGSMNNTSAEAGTGNGILAQGALVRSPIEEEDESRPLGALWGSINGATRDQNAAAATRGARPMSMAFGASNIEGPGATGADSHAQPAPEQPVATDFASRGPAPAASPDPPSLTSSASGLAINTQDHARATSSYNPPAHSAMALGTGVAEPGSVDLRGVDVEHRLSPGNGHAYEAHAQNSPHGSTASEKPVLAPIRTTALSPPPRHVEPPAEKPAGAQAPALPPVVSQQPLPQASVPEQSYAQANHPYQSPAQATTSQQPSTLAKHNSLSSGEDFIPREAAKFILDQDEGASNQLGLSQPNVHATRGPVPGQRRTFESSSEDEGNNEIAQQPIVQPWQNDPNTSPVPRQSTPMTFANMGASAKTEAEPPVKHERPGPLQVYASSARASVSPPPAQPVTSLPSNSRPGSGFSAAGGRNLGRKPSGARAPPVKTPRVAKTGLSQHPIPDDDEPQRVRALPSTPSPVPAPPAPAPPPPPALVQDDMADDLGVDALAALSFAERDQRPPTPPREQSRHVENLSRTPSPQPPAASPRPPRQAPSTLASQAQQGPAFRSSFAPSKHAAERKAKAQAHQVATEDAMKRPGRANGKKTKGMATSRSGAWESSEEEDAQDQDEDGSDDEPIANRSGPPSVHAQTHVLAPQPQQQYRGGFLGSAHGSAADLHSNTPPNGRPLPSPDAHPPHGRPLRGLPALPNQGGHNGSPDHFGQGRPPNHMYGPPSGPPSRAVSQAYDGYAEEQQQPTPPPSQQPYRGAYRQTIWNNNLDQTHRSTSPGQAQKDTFVQINPNETMTKAFTPQGLLQAGLQDKHDRSAKRQEELARESGASLLNVPNKPPPPQTGLLGAVTAHERDRKRDGGFGAVLTEREREKRFAEDRQRKIDDLQRQQLESQQSMYGGGMGMNPMMMNPMMTGMGGMPMGPMGGMGMMGFNPMMGAFDPQQQYQMWAAQQAAAEAYQRAMVSFSQAGSVAPGQGEEGGRVASPMPGQWGGGMMGGMPGMMGMGGMGMGMGMNPMMGGMSPMMTGMGGMSGMGGFGGSQFGAVSGMGAPNGMGMGGMAQGGLNPRDSEDGPTRQSASPAAEGSGNPR